MAKKSAQSGIIDNRRARYDYTLHDTYDAGIILTGPEVKAVRSGQASLKGSYVTLKDGELWLINASFSVIHSQPGLMTRTIETSPRKLLAKKKEIAQLQAARDQGLTIVPLSMTTRTRFIKVKIATAKGKKLYDKRETIKQRDLDREHKRQLTDKK